MLPIVKRGEKKEKKKSCKGEWGREIMDQTWERIQLGGKK